MTLVDVLLILCVASSYLTFSLAGTFDVTQYGAVGDGITDDSQAFLKAWNATCKATGGTQRLKVPSGKNFLLNPLVFSGPCSSAIRFQINGNLVAPNNGKGAWKNCYSNTWINFKNVDGLGIKGSGTLDAKGSIWWPNKPGPSPPQGVCQKPVTFRISDCNTAQLTGLSFLNSGGSHIAINDCDDLLVNKITIASPGDSPNTDGIDISSSRGVQILDSNIGAGDDCIAINSGVFNLNISGINCGPGHGISVGSLGKDGSHAEIDGIHVQHCTFTKTLASARIKTWPGGSGYARNIFYEHITLNDVQMAIEINQAYSNSKKQSGAVEVSQVHFTDVHGTGKHIKLDCSRYKPCQEIYLQDVNIIPSRHARKVTVTRNHANIKASNVTPPISSSK